MAEGAILEAIQISKSYPGVQALEAVDFDLRQGEIQALVGQNGAGKSTFIEIVAGSLRPDSGRIVLEGRPFSALDPSQSIELGIQTVHQENQLVDELSVAENIYLYDLPKNRGGLLDYAGCRKAAAALLSELGIAIAANRKLTSLTFIEKKLVSIAKACSRKAKVLILDEPTASLDEKGKKVLFDIIRQGTRRGLSVIYISHNLGEIFEIADRVTVLRDGRHVCDAEVDNINEEFLISNMVGRKIGNIFGERAEGDRIGEVLFEARDLARRGCFQGVNLKVHRGEIVGLAGLVGAGRTELGRAIFGAEPAESGQLFLESRPLAVRSSRQAIRQGIGYLTEDRKSHGLYLDFDVKNNLVSNHLRDFCSRIGSLKPGKIEEFAEGSVRDFRISTPGVNQILGNLSGGNQQKVLVSAWFGIRPKFLIVDEPTRGVDVGARSDIYSTLREFARRGVGILLISSDLPEILGLSDRVYVMREGRIAGELSRDQASEQNVIGLATGVQTSAKEHSI